MFWNQEKARRLRELEQKAALSKLTTDAWKRGPVSQPRSSSVKSGRSSSPMQGNAPPLRTQEYDSWLNNLSPKQKKARDWQDVSGIFD
jgi:hypothetical protein